MHLIKLILKDPIYSKILRWVFFGIASISAFLAIFFTSDRSILSACNATFIPGCVMLCLGFFSFFNNCGSFDFAEYGFISGINSLRKGSPIEYEDLIDYKAKKKVTRKENRWVFLPYAVYGDLFLIASLVLYFLYKASF